MDPVLVPVPRTLFSPCVPYNFFLNSLCHMLDIIYACSISQHTKTQNRLRSQMTPAPPPSSCLFRFLDPSPTRLESEGVFLPRRTPPTPNRRKLLLVTLIFPLFRDISLFPHTSSRSSPDCLSDVFVFSYNLKGCPRCYRSGIAEFLTNSNFLPAGLHSLWLSPPDPLLRCRIVGTI